MAAMPEMTVTLRFRIGWLFRLRMWLAGRLVAAGKWLATVEPVLTGDVPKVEHTRIDEGAIKKKLNDPPVTARPPPPRSQVAKRHRVIRYGRR